ncbi:MAG: M20/M25/M40 family metallo-hydrolase [Bullifex sp.]
MKYEEKLSRMIQVETVSVRGELNLDKFIKFQDVLRELFPHVFSVMEFSSFDGAMLLKWKSSSPKGDPILFMSHQDVVSAAGEWKHAPFSGDIADGRVWGRGTVDTKGALFCIFQALDELIAEDYKPNVDVYIASSNTEEVAGDGAPKIVKYLSDNKVHLQFLIDEGGMIKSEPLKGAKGRFAMIGTLEKGTCNFKFIAKGNGGHASVPGKNTPLVRLGEFMASVEKDDPFKAKMNDTTIEMFTRLGPTIKGPLGFVLRHARGLSPLLAKLLPKVNPLAGAMIKTTMAFTMAEGSKGLNVLPESAYVTGNSRVIHHCDADETLRIISERAKQFDIETEVIYSSTACPVVDHNGKAFRLIEDTIHELFPGVITSPYAMTGGTDARFFSPVTENAIRFAPLEIDEQQYKSIHAIDENISVDTLPKGVEFYKAIVKKM